MAAKKKNETPAPQEEEVKQDPVQEPEADVTETPAAPAEAPQSDTDKYLRLMAEFDNYKKRSVKERENIYADVRVDTVAKFLPVYDNLERALKQETADEAYRKGVEMIMTQFVSTMEKLGVTEIEALGEKFDPAKHNAVMHVDDESFGENEVVEVFQKGFKLNDKVIRFAMVKVAN